MGGRHIQAAQLLGYSITGICDIDHAALTQAGVEHGIFPARRFATAEAMFEAVRPELVIVSTTADVHCDLTCLAADAGAKFILCEKPMACSIQQCRAMIDSARKNGARLAINHARRFMPSYKETKRLVTSEEFGSLRSMTVVAGNIGLAMNGTHLFDAFSLLTEESPMEVNAWFIDSDVPNPRGPRFKDQAGSVRLTTASGKRFYLDCGPHQGHRLTIVYAGEYGQLIVDDLGGRMFCTVREPEQRDLPPTRYGAPAVETRIEAERADIVELCSQSIQSLVSNNGYPTGEEGMAAVSTLVAAYESHQKGGAAVVPWKDALPEDAVFPWP